MSEENSPVIELVNANISLNRQNHSLWAGLVVLAVCNILSINSCCKNSNAFNQTRSVNTSLRNSISDCQKKSAGLISENKKLKDYADVAHGFVLGIRPWFDENDSGCENTNCSACAQMEKENEQKFVAFTNALDTLNISQEKLKYLQRGYGE